MRKSLLLVLVLGAVLVTSSCSEDNPTSIDGEPNSMTAVVGGHAWSAMTIMARRVGTALTVTAIGPDETAISIRVDSVLYFEQDSIAGNDALTEHTFGVNARAVYTAGPATYTSRTGSLDITTLDEKHVSGRFSFDADSVSMTNPIVITGGRFHSDF